MCVTFNVHGLLRVPGRGPTQNLSRVQTERLNNVQVYDSDRRDDLLMLNHLCEIEEKSRI